MDTNISQVKAHEELIILLCSRTCLPQTWQLPSKAADDGQLSVYLHENYIGKKPTGILLFMMTTVKGIVNLMIHGLTTALNAASQ